jgi:putative membrane protein
MCTRHASSLFSGLMALTLTASSALAAGHGITAADIQFIMDTAGSSMLQVELGKYAENNAQNPVVKNFATRMVADHQKAEDEVAELANAKGIVLAGDLEPQHKAVVDAMKKIPRETFDKEYIKQMLKDHTRALADFKRVVKTTTDAELKAWVVATLPTVEEHVRLAKEAAGKLNTGRDVTMRAASFKAPSDKDPR